MPVIGLILRIFISLVEAFTSAYIELEGLDHYEDAKPLRYPFG